MVTSDFKKAAPPIAASLRVCLSVLAAMTLAGCTDRLATGTTISDDYTQRHSIVLREKPVTINIVSGPNLDLGSRNRVAQLAADAREEGARTVEILIPAGAVNEAHARAVVPAIRAALGEGGSALAISVGSYPASGSRNLMPLRISYRTVRAAVAHRCGEWPADLASGSSLETWDNRPYWNFGCSYQNMIATQLDDPRDLENPRAITPADAQIRMRGIDRVRKGSDPGTSWTTQNSGIASVGGVK